MLRCWIHYGVRNLNFQPVLFLVEGMERVLSFGLHLLIYPINTGGPILFDFGHSPPEVHLRVKEGHSHVRSFHQILLAHDGRIHGEKRAPGGDGQSHRPNLPGPERKVKLAVAPMALPHQEPKGIDLQKAHFEFCMPITGKMQNFLNKFHSPDNNGGRFDKRLQESIFAEFDAKCLVLGVRILCMYHKIFSDINYSHP